jgi:hypothetical protein
MRAARTGIEKWTHAVFGIKFLSKGKVYTVGTQSDHHSCGVCVINCIEVAMQGSTLFTRHARSKHRLEYFIAATEYLLQDPVSHLPPVARVSSSSLLC